MDGSRDLSPTRDQQWLERDQERRLDHAEREMAPLIEPLAVLKAAAEQLVRAGLMVGSTQAVSYGTHWLGSIADAEVEIRHEILTNNGAK